MILSFTLIVVGTLKFYNQLPIAQTEDNNKHTNDDINNEVECRILVTRERKLKQISPLLANI